MILRIFLWQPGSSPRKSPRFELQSWVVLLKNTWSNALLRTSQSPATRRRQEVGWRHLMTCIKQQARDYQSDAALLRRKT